MARRNKIALRESETNTRDLKLICKILKGEFVVTLRFYGWTFLAGTFYISSRLQAERRGGEVKDAWLNASMRYVLSTKSRRQLLPWEVRDSATVDNDAQDIYS